MSDILSYVVAMTGLPKSGVEAVLGLLDKDCTVPFIARYRKEATGNLDEVQILEIRDAAEEVAEREKRREAILSSLAENGLLTPEREASFRAARSLHEIEDLYLPLRPKRKTRASIAAEKGLTPLADFLEKNHEPEASFLDSFVSDEKKVATRDEALAGAKDIVAERWNETPALRAVLREKLLDLGEVVVKKARSAPEDGEFRDFYDRNERLKGIPGHRLLALLRGVEVSQLSLSLEIPEKIVLESYARWRNSSFASFCPSLKEVAEDSWKRLTQPSLENELLKKAKEKADLEAVQVFARNLGELLLAPPLGQKSVLALDPGLRTGCKVAVLSAQGALLGHTVVYPIAPFGKADEARKIVLDLIARHEIGAIAVGNGTGGRETFDFCRNLGLRIPVVSVSESGASVYSASEVAREEFPDQDVTVRGAISIGRRLMDPLAELVKIDPKAIGVGQYQHDVDQKLLKKHLDDTVVSCVNRVGVDLNTATKPILTYVSGLNAKLASAIVEHRNSHGPFRSRSDLVKVKGFGTKSFEQSAAFLRIRGSENPLDASAVHPESYPVVAKIASTLKTTVFDLIGRSDVEERVKKYKSEDWGVGEATLADILQELKKPGHDPRREFEAVEFDPDVRTVDDLREGQKLNGVVTNVTAFGAFVDVGVHQDGLVHVSQLADRFVRDPLEVVKTGQKVRVLVLSVDKERKRISLSMKTAT